MIGCQHIQTERRRCGLALSEFLDAYAHRINEEIPLGRGFMGPALSRPTRQYAIKQARVKDKRSQPNLGIALNGILQMRKLDAEDYPEAAPLSERTTKKFIITANQVGSVPTSFYACLRTEKLTVPRRYAAAETDSQPGALGRRG